jgi:hypothetical protein
MFEPLGSVEFEEQNEFEKQFGRVGSKLLVSICRFEAVLFYMLKWGSMR